MSTHNLRWYTLACLAVLGLSAAPAAAKRVDGVFREVVDANVAVLDYGDGTYRVRLFGTEAPAEGQPFAAEAREFVRQRLLDKPGAMRFRYRTANGEMVSRIFYRPAGAKPGTERDLATDLVAAGLAWVRPGAHYRPEVEGQPDALTAALSDAQADRRGIWSQSNPVAPWTYRGEALPTEAVPFGYSEGTNGNVDINISQLAGDDNECAIAKNPLNPMQLAVHCNSLDTPWRSTDGGQTWATGGTIGSYCCDPNLAWDKFGNLYATFINGGVNAIITMLSTDAGDTWAPIGNFGGGVDQPSVSATELPGGNVALWVVWNQGTMKASGALVTGLGAVGPFDIAHDANAGGSCSFGDLAVSPSGVVVQVCGPQAGETGGNIIVTVDADGLGAGPFGPPITAATTLVGGFDFIPAQNSRSVDSETGLAYDRNPASDHFGRLYLMYTDELIQESSDLNVMVRHSDNDGTSWSAPTQVNTDATTRSQFLPKISADPATGNVGICWHDTRNSAGNTAMEVWCDRTTPDTYPAFLGNVLVSDGASTSNGAGVEFGDYSGLTVGSGIAHPAWADTSNSTGDNPDGTSNFDAYTDTTNMLAADYTLGVTPPSQSICAPADAVYTVNVGAFGGYTDQVDLDVSGYPFGTTAGFSVDPVTPPDVSTLTIGNTAGGTPGPTTINVSATSTTGPKGVLVTLNLATSAASAPSLVSPADGATGVSTSAPLSWAAVAGATSYYVEVDDDNDFSSPEFAATLSGTSTTATGLLADTTYNWRVQASNACGGAFSAARTFHTSLEYCSTPNLAIPDNGAPVTDSIVIPPGAAPITDLDISITANHTWVGDLIFSLKHDAGAFQAHFDRPGVPASTFGCSDDGPDITLNDEAGTPLETACPPGPFTGSFSPNVPLSFFDGQSLSGTWTIQADDNAGSDTGSLLEWCLHPAVDSMPFLDGFETGNTSRWSFAQP